MNEAKFFLDPVTRRIWSQYFKRLGRKLSSLDARQRGELELEVQDHLLQSFQEMGGENEAERLLLAIEHLGEPDDFIKPLLADKLLDKGSRTLTPKAVFSGLYYSLFGGIRRLLLGALFGVGYILSFALLVMAVLKPFFPRNVGLLIFADGDVTFGIKLHSSGLKTDVFGYWITPLCLLAGMLIYFALSKLLRVFRRPQPG